MNVIETGVDKLVELINERKRISVDEAAKELGVSTMIVQEWADFLEEDGLISIEYSLSKVWLVERKLSEAELKKKEKEYVNKKDAFVRKVQTTLNQLEKDTDSFEKMRADFESLRKDLGKEVGVVKKEIEELKYFDDLKKNIDKDIQKQRADYEKLLHDSLFKIKSEERRFQDIIAQLDKERLKLKSEKKEVSSLEENEKLLLDKISEMNDFINKIKKEIKDKNEAIKVSEETIDKLSKMVDHLEKHVKDEKHKAVIPLLKMSEDHKTKILSMQEEILRKLKLRRSQIDSLETSATRAYNKLKDFFDKKESLEKLFSKIESDKARIKKEYDDLIKRAYAFKAVTKKDDFFKHVKELEAEYKKVESHRSSLLKKIESLSALLGKH